MKRCWKVTCAYDGTDFCGWQSQPSKGSVQDLIQEVLGDIFEEPTVIWGSGRTDSGVHANGQVFHFYFDWRHSIKALQAAIQSKMPNSILIKKIEKVQNDFHSRKSAYGKRYIYSLYEGRALPVDVRYCWSLNRRMNVELMQEAADRLVGKYDFSAFSATRGDGSYEDPVKDVWRLEIKKSGKKIKIITEGSGYLYKMVRSIVGALVDVGRNKLSPDQIQVILESKKRSRHVVTAPPHGLFLDQVFYK